MQPKIRKLAKWKFTCIRSPLWLLLTIFDRFEFQNTLQNTHFNTRQNINHPLNRLKSFELPGDGQFNFHQHFSRK